MTTLQSLSQASMVRPTTFQAAAPVRFQGAEKIGGTHKVGNLTVNFTPSVAMTAEYRDGFLKGLQEVALPGVVPALAKNGWSFSVEPKTANDSAKDVSVNHRSKTVVVRPAVLNGENVGWHGGGNAAVNALGKAINQGALSELPATVKRHGWATFTRRVSNSPEFQALAPNDGKMISYRIQKAIFGEDESPDPTGEKFFEILLNTHLRGTTEQNRQDNLQMGPGRDYWNTAMDYVGELLKPYKNA